MTDAPESPKVRFVDNPMAPDVFADSATGFFNLNGNLRVTFESVRVNHETSPGPVNRVVVGRLVMPLGDAENMAQGILAFIEQQRADSVPMAQGTPTIQ